MVKGFQLFVKNGLVRVQMSIEKNSSSWPQLYKKDIVKNKIKNCKQIVI